MGCGLRKEIEDMLSLVPGKWELKIIRWTRPARAKYEYAVMQSRGWIPMVTGVGGTKADALEDLLSKWRANLTHRQFRAPAQSREELRLKLAVRRLRDRI